MYFSAGRCDTHAMAEVVSDPTPPVLNRLVATDDRGVGLRVTVRPRQGVFNLSLWRDGECVETFHLAPGQVRDLLVFLVDGLAGLHGAVSDSPRLRLVTESRSGRVGVLRTFRTEAARACGDAARGFERLAAAIRPG